MRIPSRDEIMERLTEPGLDRDCRYMPCHEVLETCNLCFCIFYPCGDTGLGKYVITKKGTTVWSCMMCEWIHKRHVVERLVEFLADERNRSLPPRRMYLAFVKHIGPEGGGTGK